jgi:adenosylmethionine-8-amino-7-oxononanoate aminotransferase
LVQRTGDEPEALAKLIKICNENQVLTIADEVMTGLVKPVKLCYGLCRCTDMMCLSKASGGTIPMAITTFTNEIFDAFLTRYQ